MKLKKYILGMFLFVSTLGFGQYEQYINQIQPYLRDAIKSGFLFFKIPATFNQVHYMNCIGNMPVITIMI